MEMSELVAVGGDLEPETLLGAYSAGMFPMPLPEYLHDQIGDEQPIGWWSPHPRGVLPLDGLIVSRSLRKSCNKFEIRINTAFEDVIKACADPSREHGWINEEFIAAYKRLHELGFAHSVEAWSKDDGILAGGLYGVAIGGLFAGESMFHDRTDASKVALVGLVDILRKHDFSLLDVQWRTDHLATLGVVEIPRDDYLALAASAIQRGAEPLGSL